MIETIEGIADFTMSVTSIVPFEVVLEVVFRRLLFVDVVVYMCKDPIDACKFLVIRGMRQMSVIELELDEKEVEESHDHSETFFKCKAYIKHGDIVLSGDERIFDYDFE